MKKTLLNIFSILSLASASEGAFTVSINAGVIRDVAGNPVSDSSIWAIIYDANGDNVLPGGLAINTNLTDSNAATAFNAFKGEEITSGATIGLDRILWAGTVDGIGTTGMASIGGVDLAGYTFAGNNIAADGVWAVFWFPGLTDTERTLPTSSSFEVGGIQINSADTDSGGNIGMRFPSVDNTGTSYSAFFYDQANGGTTPASSFRALTAIPEPSSLMISGLAALALLRRRR